MANDTRTIGERIAAGEYHSNLACRSDEVRLRQRLRADLEGDNGTTPARIGQHKADLLWAKAWEHGRSAGLHEVAFWYVDLAELVL